MSVIGDIAGLIHDTAELVRDTRDLAAAVKDGRKFLEREHPEAKAAVSELLEQMHITVAGLAHVTAVVTAFRFTRGKRAAAAEASRFNNYVITQQGQVAALRNEIRRLKGSCDRIRAAHDELNKLGGDRDDWTSMFRLFGKERRKREQELASAMSQFYEHDQNMIRLIERLLGIAESALTEADAVLGPPGQAYDHQVGAAAEVLGVYAKAFGPTATELKSVVKDLDRALKEVGRVRS